MNNALLRKVLNQLIVTEKSSYTPELYAFYVKMDADKRMIQKAVEQLFNVKVKSIRTLIEKKPSRMSRKGTVRLNRQKKAYVTLQPDNVIEVENLESV